MLARVVLLTVCEIATCEGRACSANFGSVEIELIVAENRILTALGRDIANRKDLSSYELVFADLVKSLGENWIECG